MSLINTPVLDARVVTVVGRGLPLEGNNIDTDRIIPARFLKGLTFDGLGEQVFVDDRTQLRALGELHPFDNESFKGSSILVVNQNFGCGSSREHAAQAIARWGIKAVIGESYSEIFFGNGISVGMPCLTADPAAIADIQKHITRDPALVLELSLETLTLRVAGQVYPVTLAEGPRQQFIKGTWDATFELLAAKDKILSLEASLPYYQYPET